MKIDFKISNMRRVAGRNSRGCRAIAISIQNINPSNLLGNVVIIHLLIDIVCTNVEVTNANNDIRVVSVLIIIPTGKTRI